MATCLCACWGHLFPCTVRKQKLTSHISNVSECVCAEPPFLSIERLPMASAGSGMAVCAWATKIPLRPLASTFTFFSLGVPLKFACQNRSLYMAQTRFSAHTCTLLCILQVSECKGSVKLRTKKRYFLACTPTPFFLSSIGVVHQQQFLITRSKKVQLDI